MKQNTQRLYSLIFAMFFLAIAFVAYFDLVVPAYTDLQAAKGNLIGERALLDNEKKVAEQIKNLLATYQSQSSDVQTVNAALPVGPHLADAIAQIYGIAQANNVNLQSLSINEQIISTIDKGSTFAGSAATGQVVKPAGTIAFSFGATGSYENFKSFLKGLEANMRFFDIDTISVQAVQAGKVTSNIFTYSVTATAYYQSQ